MAFSEGRSREKGPRVIVQPEQCKGCGLCVMSCPKRVLVLSNRINRSGYRTSAPESSDCVGCGTCFYVCPEPGAITVVRAPRKEKAST